LEVLGLLASGWSDQAIAAALHTTRSTVRFHISNLFVKLGSRSRAGIGHLAYARGWLEEPSEPQPIKKDRGKLSFL